MDKKKIVEQIREHLRNNNGVLDAYSQLNGFVKEGHTLSCIGHMPELLPGLVDEGSREWVFILINEKNEQLEFCLFDLGNGHYEYAGLYENRLAHHREAKYGKSNDISKDLEDMFREQQGITITNIELDKEKNLYILDFIESCGGGCSSVGQITRDVEDLFNEVISYKQEKEFIDREEVEHSCSKQEYAEHLEEEYKNAKEFLENPNEFTDLF